MIVNIPASAEGCRLSDYLAKSRIRVSAPCGGAGKCGKCEVLLISGSLLVDGKIKTEGSILSCKSICTKEDTVIEVTENIQTGIVGFEKESKDSGDGYNISNEWGIAFDLGTTTLAMALVDIKSGIKVDVISRANPQGSFGADVISRINGCDKGDLEVLCKIIRDETRGMIDELLTKNPSYSIKTMVVAANTTMLHIFAGISPSSMGKYPFKPEFTSVKILPGEDIYSGLDRVILLPSVSAFIGSDVTAGMLAVDFCKGDVPSVFLDLGTNGEMALYTGKADEPVFCCSSAAGPAFEGVNISCGTGGVIGAVNKVTYNGMEYQYQTIGNTLPNSICGSGLVDLVSVLLQNEIIDETGLMEDGDFIINDNVFLTGEDVRQFQLAKAAVSAALKTMIKKSGVDMASIGRVYIAGGLGFYLDVNSAVNTGIIPPELRNCIQAVGNSSLAGAIQCLSDEGKIKEIERIIEKCIVLELNSDKDFNEMFVEEMFFEIG